MKILMFSGDANILDMNSAAARRMAEYGKRVEKLDIIVLARKIPRVFPRENPGENFNVYVRSGIFGRFLAGFFLARRLIVKNRHDLLIAQDVEHAKMCWLLSLWSKTSWQMQIHTDIFSPYFVKHSIFNRMRAMLAKFLIPRASCVRVVSERIKNSILKIVPRGGIPFYGKNCPAWRDPVLREKLKIDVLPIFAGPSNPNVEPKIFTEYDRTILMVSRLTYEKNIELAIVAMAEVVNKHPKTGLVIVGEGPERKNLESRILNLELNKNIKIIGWQENPVAYYKGADIFLLTSWYEGWGMSAMEAMRYGAAVIMTDVGLAGELVKDGKTGLVVPINDKNALVAAISRLLENDALRRSLIEEAAKKVRELPTVETYYERMIDIWKKCRKNI